MAVTDPALLDLETAGWGADHAHDPTAVRDDDGTYWLFSTDAYADGPVRGGVQVRRSTDLVTWTFHGWALPDVPTAAASWAGAVGLWAPEVARVGDEWRMYWSASSFGSRTSAIGLAVAPHPAGPWTDRGLVVTSTHDGIREGVSPHGDGPPNAIDANLVVDGERHWLVYGSFFGGLHALELDPATGLALAQGPGVLLARRPAAVEGAIEGPYVLPRPGGGWAMLASWDSLFDTYHVRAGVAESPTGPYVDRLGRDLRDDAGTDAGTPVLTGHRLPGGPGLRGPGHAAVLTEADRQYLVHHVRDADRPTHHRVQVRLLAWTHDAWPVVSLLPWAGTDHERTPATAWPDDPAVLRGAWDVLDLSADPRAVQPTTSSTLEVTDVVAHGSGRFAWRWGDGARAEAVVMPGLDPVRAHPTWTFGAVDDRGRVVAGVRHAAAGPTP